jgi:pimeloyl-ACP methyl ester carboxylesterase
MLTTLYSLSQYSNGLALLPYSTKITIDSSNYINQSHPMSSSNKELYSLLPLPQGIDEKYVECPAAGLRFHFLEAGYTLNRDKPLILLLHGYPELAFSWRKVMPALADAGNYVVAPDQRGYGRTTGWDTSPFEKTDLSQFTMTTLVRDLVVFVNALGYKEVHCVIGHDFGAVSASMCALMRPDMFKAVITMSHPYKSLPRLPFDTAHSSRDFGESIALVGTNIEEDLARLKLKHYKWYNSTAPAASDWDNPPQGLHEFLRGYLHVKSADWSVNDPQPLKAWSAEELSKMPGYYVMNMDSTMPETIASLMESEDASKTTSWQPDEDLSVYVQEWSRTGFQGALNWYRSQTDPQYVKDVLLFAGKKIDVPAGFISGSKDWGNYQQPGAIESMGDSCTQFRGTKFIDGAGHWPQQEQPKKVAEEILAFLKGL